jgi:hypothetical protein
MSLSTTKRLKYVAAVQTRKVPYADCDYPYA